MWMLDCHTDSVSFDPALRVIQQAVADHAFPGAAFGVAQKGKLLAQASVGWFTYDLNSPQVSWTTTYDVASLTKVVATTAMAMLLYERGRLKLEQGVSEVVREFAEGDDARRRDVTFAMLLAHASGLPAYVKLFEQHRAAQTLLHAAIHVPLAHAPGTHAEYSDIGFIILGEALQRIAGETLDDFCETNIFQPLGMPSTMFRPRSSKRRLIPPTEKDQPLRPGIIQGEVNDENAFVLRGVAGHAGLFSNVPDLLTFANSMLGHGEQLFRRETIELFTKRQPSPSGTSRALGWDTPSAPSSSGQYFSPRSYGHLGFTGTSLWINPERELAVVLLTNRTWPHRESQAIKQVRPKFHDAIVHAILNPMQWDDDDYIDIDVDEEEQSE